LGSIIQGVHPVRAEAVAWYLALAPSTDNWSQKKNKRSHAKRKHLLWVMRYTFPFFSGRVSCQPYLVALFFCILCLYAHLGKVAVIVNLCLLMLCCWAS
jgi:hypothetical protein